MNASMNKKYSAVDVAKIMGAPLASVKALYAKNAKQLRESAVKAGSGKYRGFTAKWYNDAADHAETQSK